MYPFSLSPKSLNQDLSIEIGTSSTNKKSQSELGYVLLFDEKKDMHIKRTGDIIS